MQPIASKSTDAVSVWKKESMSDLYFNTKSKDDAFKYNYIMYIYIYVYTKVVGYVNYTKE